MWSYLFGMYWWPYFIAIVNSLRLMRAPGTNFSEIVGEIQTFSFKKMHLKMSFAKWRQFCLGLNVLKSTDSSEPINYTIGHVVVVAIAGTTFLKPYFKRVIMNWQGWHNTRERYNVVIMDAIASQITSLTIFYSTVSSDAGQRKNQSSASLAFVQGIHRGPVTRKMFPIDDVIME